MLSWITRFLFSLRQTTIVMVNIMALIVCVYFIPFVPNESNFFEFDCKFQSHSINFLITNYVTGKYYIVWYQNWLLLKNQNALVFTPLNIMILSFRLQKKDTKNDNFQICLMNYHSHYIKNSKMLEIKWSMKCWIQ